MADFPKQLEELIERFDRNVEAYSNPAYNETQVRREFIDPCFEALGWDTRQLKMWRERALPDLGNNIKCGNSLIGPDFYQSKQMGLLEDHDHYRISAFNWNEEFPAIMNAGGFDAVIGNPPWGADFAEEELAYFRKKYNGVIVRMVDSYIYFIDQANRLAHANGFIGFIIPSTLLNQVDAKPIRTLTPRVVQAS
jgi:hypothetical protein